MQSNLSDRPQQRRTTFDRREFMTLGIGALVVGAIPLGVMRRHQQIFRRTIPVMGTIAEIAVVHRDSSVAQAAINDAIAALRWTDDHLSRFRLDSEIGSINMNAGIDAVHVSRETTEVVSSSLRWANATGGSFDPAMARASELWSIGSRTAPPTDHQVHRYAGRRLYEKVVVGSRAGASTIGLDSADAALDLGGIAKGYGVDRAVAAIRRHGVEHALVNAGGDLYALGDSPEGRPWRVGLRSPKQPDQIERTIELSDRAVATSGDYMQYFEFRGRRYHHLLDPTTGEPVTRTGVSVTVFAGTCMDADAGATAAFALGHTKATAALRSVAANSELLVIV